MELPQKTQVKPYICNTSLQRALHNMVAVNQIVDKNPRRIVILLQYSNKINSLKSEQVFYSIELKTCSELSE